jgi:ABC-2 type transport system ATP-binding protein
MAFCGSGASMTVKELEPVLRVQDLRKSFGPIKALGGVSFSIRSGQFVVLLGPNGAGKSTLLQLLTGLFSPDQGTIEILGLDLRKHAIEAMRSIGVVFQQQTLDLEMSVRANLLFHADLHGMPRKVSTPRIAVALDHFGLTDRTSESVRNLSGGNRRRVELARALLHDPRVLLMDEATSGLDPASRRNLLEHILKIRYHHNVGVLWTTHLVDEAEHADRLLVIHKGKLLHDDTPEALERRTGHTLLTDAFLDLTSRPEDRTPTL